MAPDSPGPPKTEGVTFGRPSARGPPRREYWPCESACASRPVALRRPPADVRDRTSPGASCWRVLDDEAVGTGRQQQVADRRVALCGKYRPGDGGERLPG